MWASSTTSSAGVDEKHFVNANPLAVYESGMASLLPDKCGPRKTWGPQPAFEGVGIIDRDILNSEARTSSLPRYNLCRSSLSFRRASAVTGGAALAM